MAFPAEHYGKKKIRKWYKVVWKSDNKLDLLIDEDYEKSRKFVDVLKEIKADTCAEGLRKITSEKDIDDWIEKNKV